MSDKQRNIAASVAARLLNHAKRTGEDYQTVLTSYCFERFLYRLGESDLRDRFVLKGAMLFRVWSHQRYRATRDLDLLRRGEGSLETLRNEIGTICVTAVADDGIVFRTETVRVEPIRARDDDVGGRVTLTSFCSTARLSLQIDVGVGDAVWPEPRRCAYPSLLTFPPPDILAYSRETVVAEKLEAMVVLGDRNSRIKDFFDLHHLASHFAFERATLTEAVRRSFVTRGTPVPVDAPVGLTPVYWENPSRPAQVRAFARRAGLPFPNDADSEIGRLLREFLLPILADLRDGNAAAGSWAPGGPWK
jgi:predicted nucleotidyltransferase component of viral defense system